MKFIRSLLGLSPTDNSKATSKNAADENTVPTTPVSKAGVSPNMDKRATEEIFEAAVTDPTPIMFGVTRQLPPLESVVDLSAKTGKQVIYGLSSDVGMIRSNNQDSLYTFVSTSVSAESKPDFGLFIVADGMGGHHDGELASAIAARVVGQHVVENFYVPILKLSPNDTDRPIISEVLSEAVQKANETVSNEIPDGGTTITAAALVKDLLYVAHVGDSRAYIVTSDDIEQLTRDHSLVQRLIELDQLTPEEAAVHPQRNVLYRAIGQSDNLEVDVLTRRLTPGCKFMLCSDGLWNQVGEDNLKQIIGNTKTPQEACDHLIKLANDRGGPDNITVVIVQLPG